METSKAHSSEEAQVVHPLMTMLDAAAGKWNIDAPLAEIAVKRGFGNKKLDLRQFRQDLCCCAGLAIASAKTEIAINKLADKERRKTVVITEFLKFIDGLEDEISELDHLLSKFPELCDQQSLKNLQRFHELGEAIRPIAGEYINGTELLHRAPSAGATKYEEREFFTAVLHWWSSNVFGTWTGYSALRDRLAGALWVDLGRSIPKVKDRADGKFYDQDGQDWAKDQFKLLRKKQGENRAQTMFPSDDA